MGSRDRDHTAPHHQPLLSSLVVRPSTADGLDGGGRLGGGADYEPGEVVRRDPPPYSRSDRYADDPGYRTRPGSVSPLRRRDADHRYGSDFARLGGPNRGRDFGGGRDPGRFRDASPPRARPRGGGRPLGRGFDGPGYAPAPFRGEGMNRNNNPNVRPREGDWYCSDPVCGNLNFARREFCNNCKKPRHGPGGSPRRGYPGPPPLHGPPRRYPGPPLDLSPGRDANGFRSPPRGWARDGPRDFGPGGPPPPRFGGSRFPDHDLRRDRLDYPDEDYRGDRGQRDRGRDSFFSERKGGFLRRPPSPPPPLPLPPPRGRFGRDVRERSRSPIRGAPPPKDYRRDMYMDRGRDDRRSGGRDAF